MIGHKVGSYQITGELSEGGMGAVYTAVHMLIGRKTAIKVLLPEFSRNHEILQRFFQEAKATVAIGHPGIVEILDFGFDAAGTAYLVMEFLDGKPLSSCLQSPMDEDRAIALIAQVTSALAAAHARGIVHRDLKPANIMVMRDTSLPFGERTKILDFGIAKLTTESDHNFKTRTGQVLGTPAYMAPEQCRGAGRVDHRADLYALGCILFHMLCGQPPFVAEGYGEVLGMHMYEPPPALRALRPELDPMVESLVLRLLNKDPGARLQSAELLLAEIDAIRGYRTPVPGLGRAPTHPFTSETAGVSMPMAAAKIETTLRGSAGAQPVQPALPRTWRSRAVPVSAATGLIASVAAAAWFTTQRDHLSQDTLNTEPSPLIAGAPLITENADAGTANESAQAMARIVTDSPAPAHAPPQTAVRINITAKPTQVGVYQDGKLIGHTPFSVELPHGTEEAIFTLKKPGYEDERLVLVPDRDHNESIALRRRAENRANTNPVKTTGTAEQNQQVQQASPPRPTPQETKSPSSPASDTIDPFGQ